MTTSSLIADVNVVDVRDGTVTTHQDVHVTDGIISSISGTAGAAGRGEQRLDRPGAFWFPGSSTCTRTHSTGRRRTPERWR